MSPECVALLSRVLQSTDARDLADQPGLNPNTISRWIEQSRVPSLYRRDLLHVLGLKVDPKGSGRDKDQFYTCDDVARDCFRRFKSVAADGEPVDVEAIFQVWTRINTHNIRLPKPKTCKQFIKVYSLSDGRTLSSTRNKKRHRYSSVQTRYKTVAVQCRLEKGGVQIHERSTQFAHKSNRGCTD